MGRQRQPRSQRSSSLWYANVGHGRVEIAEAIRKQLAQLETFHTFGEFTNGPAEQWDRLAGLSPSADSKVFLVSGEGMRSRPR